MASVTERKAEAIGESLSEFVTSYGLRGVVVRRPGFQKTYATYATRYGSIDNHFVDPASGRAETVTDGIAHFLEHKMFEKPGGGDVFEDFARLGASANAYTEYSSTTYLFSTTAHVWENLDILLRFLHQPYFTPANVEKEKGIIEQEIRMYLDLPGDRLHANLMRALYQRHPVRVEVAGTVESIRTITPETLYLCHRTFYHPSNMLLVVVGDVDPERVLAVAERARPETGAGGPIQRIYPPEPPTVARKRAEQAMPVATPLFLMGYKDHWSGELTGRALLERSLATELMWALLLSRSSTLYSRLYDSGLINDRFSAQYSHGRTFGFSALGGETPDPERLEAVLVEGLARTPLAAEDLERLKRREMGQFIALFQNPEELAFVINALAFRDIDLWQYWDALQQVSLEAIEKRRAEHLREEARAVSVVVPSRGR
jgi:predicted Zn-dependent peptidase